jgi:hypothetical protein
MNNKKPYLKLWWRSNQKIIFLYTDGFMEYHVQESLSAIQYSLISNNNGLKTNYEANTCKKK